MHASSTLLGILSFLDLSSEPFNHHVELNFVQIAVVVKVQNREHVFKTRSTTSFREINPNLVETPLQLLLLELAVVVQVELREDLRALLDVIEVALADHDQEHELVHVQTPVVVIVG